MKKQSLITVLLTVLLSMMGSKALAYDVAVENQDGKTIYYNYINNGTELEVTWGLYAYSNDINIPSNVFINEKGIYLNVTSIGEEAFYGSSTTKSVTIPNSVLYINNRAFYGCTALEAVDWGNSVVNIGYGSFQGCNKLKTVTIPNSVNIIGEKSFADCSALTSVTIGKSVNEIGYFAFENCKKLTKITSLMDNPVEIIGKTTGSTFYKDTYDNAMLYVPAGKINTYMSTPGWCDFAHIEEIDNSGDETHMALIAEKNWRNATDEIWASGLEGGRSVTISEEGIVIYNPQQEEMWQPITIILADFSLKMGHSYYMKITAKTLSDGQLCFSTGNWYTYAENYVNISAKDEFQTIEITTSPIAENCEGDAHILLYSGYLVGTIVIEKVQLFDLDGSSSSVSSFDINGIKYNVNTSRAAEVCDANTDLKSIDIPEKVTYDYMTYTVTSIADKAFNNCKLLEDISIPQSIESIGSNAFYGCNNLRIIKSFIKNPFDIETNTFGDITYDKAKLIVPQGKISAYQSKSGWNRFSEIKEINAAFEYVDLGLPSGNLWAKTNVGAYNEYECGDYYAFGETSTKDYYYLDTYKWFDFSLNKYTKYTVDFSFLKPWLTEDDDVATKKWGEMWHTPRISDFSELEDNCTSTWENNNGIMGRRFTGTNGNSIFFPAAGYYYVENQYKNELGYYMTGDVESDENFYLFHFSKEEISCWWINVKYQGYSVRPVTNKMLTKIEEVYQDDNNATEEIYDLRGMRRNELSKGLNIIKTKDGKTKKIYIK